MKQLKPDDTGTRLQPEHYSYIIKNKPDIAWFEALTENYIGEGEMPLLFLDKIRQDYPLSFHGIGLSLGSAEPLNIDYMHTLKYIINRYQPQHISDHLSWTSFQQHYNYRLLPFPFNNNSLQAMADKISMAQDFLGQEILVENPSSHAHFKSSDICEYDFTNELLKQTGCKLLLNIDNLLSCSKVSGIDTEEYIHSINRKTITKIHLQDQEMNNKHPETTNTTSAWHLYQKTIELTGPVPSLIKGHTGAENFISLKSKVSRAKKILNQHSSNTISRVAANQ